MNPGTSVLVCSRNGGDKLRRMLDSVERQDAEIREKILLDDGSEPPLREPGGSWRTVRFPRNRGYIASRNELAQLASQEFMVFLDDDVILDDSSVIRRAATMMEADAKIGAVAFQQRDVDGKLLDLQPIWGNQRKQIAAYFGWAHLIRRSAWQKAGPFLEVFQYGFEETEFSLRLLDAGFTVIGDPLLSVIHDSGSSSKNLPHRHYLNQRNMLLTILLRYPARAVPSWLKGAALNYRPHPLSREPVISYRLRLLWALILKLPYILLHRKPVTKRTFTLFWQLQK